MKHEVVSGGPHILMPSVLYEYHCGMLRVSAAPEVKSCSTSTHVLYSILYQVKSHLIRDRRTLGGA